MNMLNSRQKLILLICLALVINLALWIFLWQMIEPSPYPIILHYNIYFGADYLGNVNQVYTLPGVGLIIISVNSVLAFLFLQREKIVGSCLLVGILPLVQIFLFIAGIAIVIINR